VPFVVAGSLLAVIVAVVVVWRRRRAPDSTNDRAALLTATEWLDDESQRTMRVELLDMHKLGTNVPTNEAYVVTAEKVGRVCQTIGYYVKHRFIPGDVVIDNWGRDIVNMWDACRPWVEFRREDEEAPTVWSDFEWLAGKAREKYPRPTGASSA